MAVSFDIGILPNRPFAECVDLCVTAEELGYGGVWVADSQSVMRDAYALLAVAATRTDRIRLATGVTNALTRHLAVLACSWRRSMRFRMEGRRSGSASAKARSRTLGSRPTVSGIWRTRFDP